MSFSSARCVVSFPMYYLDNARHGASLNVFNVTMHYSRWLFSLSFSISIELFIIVSSFSSISPGRPADNNAGVIVLLAVTHGMIDPHPFGGIFA